MVLLIMVKMLIVADDLSGALDTAVAFAADHIQTIVSVDTNIRECAHANPDAAVLAVDAKTRHLDPEKAYRIVFDIVKEAKALGIPCIYKKADSALRGNIGSELNAALCASGESQIHFAPAFPKHKRFTIGGIHYIDGIPVAQSVFGRDPFERVKQSSVLDIIAAQTGTPAVLSDTDTVDTATNGIIVHNIGSTQDMERLAAGLYAAGKASLLAGCGGLAQAVLAHLPLPRQAVKSEALISDRLLLVCGSVNPITAAQIELAERAGFARLNLPIEIKLGTANEQLLNAFFAEWKDTYHANNYAIIDTMDLFEPEETLRHARIHGMNLSQMRQQIALTLGQITKRILDDGFCGTLMVTGGDTVLGLLHQLEVHTLIPICEIAPGTILSQLTYKGKRYQLLTKSGGFGDQNLFMKLMRKQIDDSRICMKTRPIIGITMGDPAGNGPEITLKALSRPEIYAYCRPLVIGDAKVFEAVKQIAGCGQLSIHAVNCVSEAKFAHCAVDVLHLDLIDMHSFEYGKVSAMCGNAAFQCVKKVIELAIAGEVDATCTNALNKEAMNLALQKEHLHFDGHTEIFAAYTHTTKYAMMLAHHDLRVMHVSTHCSLREACDRVKKERVLDVIRIADRALKEYGILAPRVAVAGLNPHAGENGLFGREELEEILPAIEQARLEGILAEGPFAADSLFSKALGGWYDVVIAMYHDQGHIPLKTVGFVYDRERMAWKAVEGVNITLGLPIIRTSVDHGTGFDQAGKGTSSELSLVNALDYATRMAQNKQRDLP